MFPPFGKLKHSMEGVMQNKNYEFKRHIGKKNETSFTESLRVFFLTSSNALKTCKRHMFAEEKSSDTCDGHALHETYMTTHVCEKLQLACLARETCVS